MLVFKRGEGSAPKLHKTTPEYLDGVNERAHVYLRQYLGHDHADQIWLAGQKIHDLHERAMYYAQAVVHVEEDLRGQSSTKLQDWGQYKWNPVGIKEFICSPHYLNKEAEIYPGVLEAAEELNNGNYVEAIMTGGIGSGKTTLALYTNAYQLYLLSCMRSPAQAVWAGPVVLKSC